LGELLNLTGCDRWAAGVEIWVHFGRYAQNSPPRPAPSAIENAAMTAFARPRSLMEPEMRATRTIDTPPKNDNASQLRGFAGGSRLWIFGRNAKFRVLARPASKGVRILYAR
jgi:hypothetical protein